MEHAFDVLIEFGKMLIPASIVLYATYLLTRMLITKELDTKRLEIKEKSIETTLPLRLQAYERMTLFLERISPQNLLTRLNDSSHSAHSLHKTILTEIQNEYQHNIAQQVYMSEEVWALIKNAKDNLIARVDETATQMQAGATGAALAQHILQTLIDRQIDPTAEALSKLKKEIQQVF